MYFLYDFSQIKILKMFDFVKNLFFWQILFVFNFYICYHYCMKNCTNCGGKLFFSPKDKGNKCEQCGSVFPIEYNYEFVKKPFEENLDQGVDELAKQLKSMRCKSCGATVMLNKYQMQANCPYCGNSDIAECRNKKIMHIDSIIPFAFGKAEAVTRFKRAVKGRFYANTKIFKNLTVDNINGAYVNAFVFDMNTSNFYSGTLSYTITERNEEGNSKTRVVYKNVSGNLDKDFKNIAIEVNSNLDQSELLQIMPFEYGSAVAFDKEFMHDYMLEYQDKLFKDCVDQVEKIIKRELEKTILKRYNCDRIVKLDLNTNYTDRKYNYCLLPVYFVTKEYKDKKYRVVMNGQSGKVGDLPKNVWRIVLSLLLVCGFVVAIIFLIMYFS